MRFRFTTFFLILFVGIANVTPAFSQLASGTVTGLVRTADDEPAEAVNVALEGTSLGSTTDESGRYLIDEVSPGTYTLRISSVGLSTKEQSVTVTAGDTTQVQTITLAESTQELQEIVIQETRNTYEVDQPSRSLQIKSPLAETPQNIQVITPEVLNDQQAYTMRQGVVRNVSGASRVEHWGHYARIHMRGSRIAAFRNGMNVSSNWGPLAQDLSMVERIEFVKGPAGFMMANGEPGGFYNVVTEKPTGITGRSARLTLGSFQSYRATADLDGRFDDEDNWLYRLNLLGETENSHIRHDYHQRYAVAPVLRYRPGAQTSITAEYTYQQAEYLAPGAGYQFSAIGYEDVPRNFTMADPDLDPTHIYDHSAFLTLEHQLNENWSATGKLAYFDYAVQGASVWPFSVDSSGVMQRGQFIWDGHLNNQQGQVFVNGEMETGPIGHRMLAGLEVGDKRHLADFGQWRTLEGPEPFNIYDPTYGLLADSLQAFDRSTSVRKRATWDEKQRHTALYLQDELQFWEDQVRLTLAGRFTSSNDNDVQEEVFTPRAGISITTAPGTRVYGLYDEAFVPQAGANAAGESFDPVTGHNIEVGLKRDWSGAQWRSTLALYQITKNNVLTTDPENPEFSIALGQTQTRGAEFDVRGHLLPGLSVVLNYAYTDSKVTEDTDEDREGSHMSGTARHMSNGWLTYRFASDRLEGFGLSLGYRSQIDRFAWVYSGDQQSLPDYLRIDGGISWQNDRFNISLNINNLLNEYLYSGRLYSGGFYYWKSEPPRNFRLSLGYTF